jgi:hypothetical protein
MISTSQWQLPIDHARSDPELLQKQFDSISPVYIVDEYDGFTPDELEFEENVEEEEFIGLGGRCEILD